MKGAPTGVREELKGRRWKVLGEIKMGARSGEEKETEERRRYGHMEVWTGKNGLTTGFRL